MIRADLIEEVVKLKRQSGQNILLVGSASVARALMRNNLVDDYHLLVYPILLGRGKRLFDDGTNGTLEPVEARTLGSSVVHLRYRANTIDV